MRAELLVILGAELLRRFGDGAPGPPAADRASDPAEQRADGARRRSDACAEQHARDSAGCFADLVAKTGLAVVRAKCRVLCDLDSPICRISFGHRVVAVAHAVRP